MALTDGQRAELVKGEAPAGELAGHVLDPVRPTRRARRRSHLYRADEIAEPGQITQQIKDSIAGAHLTIADVTNMNPNVCGTSGTPTAWDGPSPS